MRLAALARMAEDVHVRSGDGKRRPEAVDEGPTSSLRRLSTDPVLWLTVLGAAILRAWRIGTQALWYDEYITTRVVQAPLLDLPGQIRWREGTPPLYFLMEWVWIRIFGRGDAALRSSSALVGTLTVVVVYALLVQLRQTRRTARIGAALVAFHPMLVWYSRDARSYALFAFTMACTLLALTRALDRQRTVDHLLWSIVAATAFATHYFAVFLLAPQAVWLLIHLWRQRRWRDAVVAFGPLAVASGFLLQLAFSQRSAAQDWISEYSMAFRLTEAGRTFLIGPGQPSHLFWLLTLVPLAVAVVRCAGPGKERRVAGRLAALAAIGFVLSLVLAGPYFLGRNSIGIIVVLAVALAIGLGRRPEPLGSLATVALCTLWIAVSLWVSVDPDLQKANWKKLATAIDQRAGQEDTVLLVDHFALGVNLHRYLEPGITIVGTDDTVMVQEIDLLFHLGRKGPCGSRTGGGCDIVLFPHLPEELKTDFEFSGHINVDRFVVSRYRSDEPIRLRPDQLVANPGSAIILLRE